jgi:hypothetical protein
MADSPDILSLKIAQVSTVLEQYRATLYNIELRHNLLIKMMEEKGLIAPEEFEKRWPLYLKNTVGVVGQDGVMEGNLKVRIYGEIKNA